MDDFNLSLDDMFEELERELQQKLFIRNEKVQNYASDLANYTTSRFDQYGNTRYPLTSIIPLVQKECPKTKILNSFNNSNSGKKPQVILQSISNLISVSRHSFAHAVDKDQALKVHILQEIFLDATKNLITNFQNQRQNEIVELSYILVSEVADCMGDTVSYSYAIFGHISPKIEIKNGNVRFA